MDQVGAREVSTIDAWKREGDVEEGAKALENGLYFLKQG